MIAISCIPSPIRKHPPHRERKRVVGFLQRWSALYIAIARAMGLQMACWLRVARDNPRLERTSALCESHSLTSKDCPSRADTGCVGLNTTTSSHHEAKSFVIRATASFPGLSALMHNLLNVKIIRESPNDRAKQLLIHKARKGKAALQC